MPRTAPQVLLPLLFALALPACGEAEPRPERGGTATADTPVGLAILNPTSERDYFHDFGKVPYGDTVHHVFEIENREAEPVTIHDLHASCSCTSPTVEYTDADGQVVRGRRRGEPVLVLPPGAVARLEMAVDTYHIKYKNTDKLTMVVVRSDSRSTPFLRLEAHLFVTQAFQVTPEAIDLGEIPISSGARARTDIITGVPGSLYRILEVLETSEGLTARIAEDARASETLWQVQVELAPPLEFGPWQGHVLLGTTAEDGSGDGAPLRVEVRGRVVADVVPYPPVFGFLSPAAGAGPRAEGSLRALAPGHRIKIVDAELVGEVPDGLRVQYEADGPDAEGRSSRWRLLIEAPADLELELFTGILRVILEDPEQKPIEIDFVYRRN